MKKRKPYRVYIEFSAPFYLHTTARNKNEARKKIYDQIAKTSAMKVVIKSLTYVECQI